MLQLLEICIFITLKNTMQQSENQNSSLINYNPLKYHLLSSSHYRCSNGASIFTTSGVAARKFQNEVEAGLVG